MSVIEALTALTGYAQDAQTSGMVPTGPYAIALAVLIAGSQATLRSGVLEPNANIEVDDIGLSFEEAMNRMRIALSEGLV